MEYILFLTYRCNLQCKYCFAKNVVHNEKTRALTVTSENIDNICQYIRNDIKVNSRQNNSIVFFGGEPSLVPNLIIDIINKTIDLDMKYSIYTNGLLLHTLSEDLLKHLHCILVAIDGDRESHEQFKPQGSYDKIIENVRIIKERTDAQIIARITMEETTNIFDSVTNLLDHFDYVHWQIVNKPHFDNLKKMLADYDCNIRKLFQNWLKNLKEGVIQQVIPFNRIALSMLADENELSFRCGCGKSILAIDVEGNLYSCDEYVEDKKYAIGNITDNDYNLIKYKSHLDLFDDCKTCEVSSICLGRCRKALETQTDQQIKNYCYFSKILINIISNSIDEIREILTRQKIDLQQLHTEIYDTEIIP